MASQQPMNMAERVDALQEALATHFASLDDAAMAYLGFMEGAAPEGQITLFEMIITLHGTRKVKKQRPALPRSLPVVAWKAAVKRLQGKVTSLAHAIIRTNSSTRTTAEWLWDQITLCEGDDRCVALGMFLALPIVPYAQVLPDITLLKSDDAYGEAREGIPGQIALLNRLLALPDITTLELSVATEKILRDPVLSDDARVMLLNHVIVRISRGNSSQSSFHILGGYPGAPPEQSDELEDDEES